jgi:hypothetical protein
MSDSSFSITPASRSAGRPSSAPAGSTAAKDYEIEGLVGVGWSPHTALPPSGCRVGQYFFASPLQRWLGAEEMPLRTFSSRAPSGVGCTPITLRRSSVDAESGKR